MSKRHPLNYFKHSEDFTAYKAGQQIFVQGQDGSQMFVVKSGKVNLVSGNVILETVETGGVLGEMALLDEGKRSATAVAATDCQLVAIDQERFLFLCQKTPDFALELMRIMAKRLRQMDKRHTKIFDS